MQLIITEKETVAEKFSKALKASKRQFFYLGQDAIIVPLSGHIRQLLFPEEYDPKYKPFKLETLPIIPSTFKYKTLPQFQRLVSSVESLFERFLISRIVIATDCGREGELLGRLALEAFQLPVVDVYRFWTTHGLNDETIRTGLREAKPIETYDALFWQGKARQQSDWLIGMNFSRALSVRMNHTFHVGRVQSATLNLIYQREYDIAFFEPKKYAKIKGRFKINNHRFDANYYNADQKSKIRDLGSVEGIINSSLVSKATVLGKDDKIDRELPPTLLNTAEIQKIANQKWGYPASRTHQVLENLYIRYAAISYPRSDSKHLPTNLLPEIKDNITRFAQRYHHIFDQLTWDRVDLSNMRVFDDEKLSDHHAIIPENMLPEHATREEHNIYFLIMKRFAACFSRNHAVRVIEVKLLAGDSLFISRAREVVDPGWKAIFNTIERPVSIDEDENGSIGALSLVGSQSEIHIEHVWAEYNETSPPENYTEGTLIAKMEKPDKAARDGLGTSSSRHKIIDSLKEHKYIAIEHKHLRLTESGAHLIYHIRQNPDLLALIDPMLTTKWERDIKEDPTGMIGDIVSFTMEKIEFIKSSDAHFDPMPKNSFESSMQHSAAH
jgi:DNA topoisomerase-3